MKKLLLEILLIHIFVFVLNDEQVLLQINKSKSHTDKTNNLTPLVVSVSSEDKNEKTNGVYIICIVDVSGSMYDKIDLVKDSLKYLIEKLMTDEDYFSLITFTSDPSKVCDFTQMTSANKATVINKINNLRASGGTNIYSGLQEALKLITQDFATNEKVVSMILLSDGYDGGSNADTRFKQLISRNGKNKIPFTLHTFGYGERHDADLMYKISLIKDGGYFFINKISRCPFRNIWLFKHCL